MKSIFIVLFFVSFSIITVAQTITAMEENSPKLEIPDIPGFYTMKCDFHMHTIFSDGKVWPDIRVYEAIAEGLDAISITDHVEHHRKGVEDNHIMGYEIAKKAARGKDLVVVPGGEISASKDHYNALFLSNQDEPELRDKIPANRIAAANKQGGFVFWNHPGWTAKYKDGNAPVEGDLIPLLKNGQVKGIEVCNGDGYWENAHKMVVDNKLTLIGNSDMHGISYYMHQTDKHRTVTLVFAKEKSVEGIQDALLNQRTAIYRSTGDLIGDEKYLKPIFNEAVQVSASYRRGTSIVQLELKNESDIDFVCDYKGDYKLYNSLGFISIPAHTTTIVGVKTNEILEDIKVPLLVHNAITAPGKKLNIDLPVVIDNAQ